MSKKRTKIDDIATDIAEIFTDYRDEAYDELTTRFAEWSDELTKAEFTQLGKKLKSHIESGDGWQIDDIFTLRELFEDHANGVTFPKIII